MPLLLPPLVRINWSREIHADQLSSYRPRKGDHLYMILKRRRFFHIPARQIEYIGMAYKQTVVKRLSDHHELPKILKERMLWGEVTIRFGQVKPQPMVKLNKKLVEDVEAALIYQMYPEHNDVHKKSYRRKPIRIRNMGRFKPLPRSIDSFFFEK